MLKKDLKICYKINKKIIKNNINKVYINGYKNKSCILFMC